VLSTDLRFVPHVHAPVDLGLQVLVDLLDLLEVLFDGLRLTVRRQQLPKRLILSRRINQVLGLLRRRRRVVHHHRLGRHLELLPGDSFVLLQRFLQQVQPRRLLHRSCPLFPSVGGRGGGRSPPLLSSSAARSEALSPPSLPRRPSPRPHRPGPRRPRCPSPRRPLLRGSPGCPPG